MGLSLSLIYPFHLSTYIQSEVAILIGVTILILSLSLNTMAYKEFKQSVTPHAPFMTPKVLIQKNIFSLSRNPVYIALILSEFGLAFIFDTLWLLFFAGLLWISLDIMVVRDEEKVLESSFQQDYLDYKKKTRRWI